MSAARGPIEPFDRPARAPRFSLRTSAFAWVKKQGEQVGRELWILAEHLDDSAVLERRHALNAAASFSFRRRSLDRRRSSAT
jgi:hypothetical protein